MRTKHAGFMVAVVLSGLGFGCSKTAPTSFDTPLPTQPTTGAGDKQTEEINRNVDIRVSQSNLGQIGAAFALQSGTLQAGFGDKDGKPLLSWRVALLPNLGKDDLFRKFKLNEPWDSEHNKALLKEMPDVFKPVRGNAPPGYTFYRTFVGEGALFPTHYRVLPGITRINGQTCVPLFNPLNLTQVSDGTSNTYLVVEGGDAVPWTKPEELVVEKGKPLPKLGGLFDGDFNILLCDTVTVGLVRKTTAEEKIRAAVTTQGGESVDPEAVGKPKP